MINEDEIEHGTPVIGVNWSVEEIEYLNSLEVHKNYCESTFTPLWGTYSCTREQNHRGIHIAHGLENAICAVWDDEEADK